MKKLGALLLRISLFSVFISYFVVAIIVNSDRIENRLDPLTRLGLREVRCLRHNTLCLGTYANEKDLGKYHIRTVISILNPIFPFSREIVQAQKETCRKMNIDFVSIPISFFSDDENIYKNLLRFLHYSKNRPVYINGYLFDHRLEELERRIIMQDIGSE